MAAETQTPRGAERPRTPGSADPGDRSGRARRVLAAVAGSLWARAALVYLGLRLVSGLLLAQAADQQVWFPAVTGPRERDIDLAVSWDAKWYEQIATDGYPDALPVGPDGRVQQNPWAFYPLFPYAVRAVMALTGAGFADVAPRVALLAGLGAAIVIAYLLRDGLPGRSAGPALGAVAVWAAFPSAPVLAMAYTESFSVLLLAGVLLALLRRWWWTTAALALLLGLTRPIALPLALVVAVAAWMRWRERRTDPVPSHERLAIGATVVATGLSGVAWTALSWWGTGRRDAYPATMGAWRGDGALRPLEPWQRTLGWAVELGRAEFVVPVVAIALALATALLCLVPGVAPGVDLRLRVWCAAYAGYLLVVVDGTTSIVRYLLPLFPLALVLVGAHRERVSRWWRWRTAFWVAAGVLGQVGWIWWLVLFTPPYDFPP